jgi:hypothetical protein
VLGLFTAAAQPTKTLKEQLVGIWDQVVTEATTPDGKKSFPFGEKPNGILIFTADGRFAQVHIASGIPKFAANSRTKGTDEENKAVVSNSVALFGTYAVDEEKKLVTYTVRRPLHVELPRGPRGGLATPLPD